MLNKKIAVLLPYKDQFISSAAGSASIWVKDFSKKSKYLKNIIVYGSTQNTKDLIKGIKYKNLEFNKYGFGKNLNYVNKFVNSISDQHVDLIEIHNRPSYLINIKSYFPEKNYILVFHNNPQTLEGSRSVKEREKLINICSKIIFVSNWVKEKFFQGLRIKNSENCEIIYPSIDPINKMPKKEKIITFVGKLNHSKGYDLFGKSIIKILNEHEDWKALVIGDEPREKYNFFHPRLKLIGWVPHFKTLKFFEKSSITVVPSTWEEPFGRTALEAGSRGSSVILSKIGGLVETISDGFYLKKINSQELYKNLKKLINSKKLRVNNQIKLLSNVLHKTKTNTQRIDKMRQELFFTKNINVNSNKKNFKIINISNFGSRLNYRLYYISIAKKLSNGLIRKNNDVLNISDRDVTRYNKTVNDLNGTKYLNKLILDTTMNYKPDLLLLGHAYDIDLNTLYEIKRSSKNIKIAQWFEDHLHEEGPDYKSNRSKLLKYDDVIDHNFITTHPSSLNFLRKRENFNYLPIPVDKNIENLNISKENDQISDVFFSMSHGVNRGSLKKNKIDERNDFINKLLDKCPNINFDIYGFKNKEPVWANDFYKAICNSKMALNLSRGKAIKYLTSNRIASLVGNGLLTFVDKKTKLDNFFNKNEMVFYNSVEDLSDKINFYKNNDKTRRKIGDNGKKKYFKLFDCEIVAEFILSKIFQFKIKQKLDWMD